MKLTSLNLIDMKLKVDHAQRAKLQSHELRQNELYRFDSNKVMLLSNIYVMLYQKHNLIAETPLNGVDADQITIAM